MAKRENLFSEFAPNTMQEWVDKVNEHLSKVGYKVDPFTFRFLRRSLPKRQKDIVERKIATSFLAPNVRQIFKRLTPTLDNVDEIKSLVQKYIVSYKEMM